MPWLGDTGLSCCCTGLAALWSAWELAKMYTVSPFGSLAGTSWTGAAEMVWMPGGLWLTGLITHRLLEPGRVDRAVAEGTWIDWTFWWTCPTALLGLKQLARWLSTLVLTSVLRPSTELRYLVTSLEHSLNPAMYLLSTSGSPLIAAVQREEEKGSIIKWNFKETVALGYMGHETV